MLESIKPIAAEWLKKTTFADAFIFGSLIHKGGIQFNPTISDVDLVSKFSIPDEYRARWKAVLGAVAPSVNINLTLLNLFGRRDASTPIVSIVPTTQYELESGIHKDKAPQFFSHNSFHSVKTGEISAIGNELVTCTSSIECRFNAIREAQRYRNKILSIAPAGTRATANFDGSDVLPKELSRCAAQVRWARDEKPQAEQRFDLNEGFMYMVQILISRRNESSDVDDLLQRIMIRMGGRGTRAPLTPSDQLLLWEMLVDDAAAIPSIVEVPKPVAVKLRNQRHSIPAAIRQAALQRAGGCCSYPGCGVPLGVNGIGEIAFILSPNKGGPRHNPSIPPSQATELDNILLLCPTHHRMIDRNPDEYPVDMLKGWNHVDHKADLTINATNLPNAIRHFLKRIN